MHILNSAISEPAQVLMMGNCNTTSWVLPAWEHLLESTNVVNPFERYKWIWRVAINYPRGRQYVGYRRIKKAIQCRLTAFN